MVFESIEWRIYPAILREEITNGIHVALLKGLEILLPDLGEVIHDLEFRV
jgi:hypothetical protein